MWVRGLKLINRENNQFAAESHPMWVRGLKLIVIANIVLDSQVAPYVGAWIETIAT